MERQPDEYVRTRIMGVLNRNWIDLDRASIDCSMGRVLLKGELRRRGPQNQPMASRSVDRLEKELTETRGVRRVDLNLQNWVRTPDGRWRPKQAS